MYSVDTRGPAGEQITALAPEGLGPFAELRVMLETSPWSGEPYMAERSDGPMRTCTFGIGGLATYLILEDQRRVDILLVQWVE